MREPTPSPPVLPTVFCLGQRWGETGALSADGTLNDNLPAVIMQYAPLLPNGSKAWMLLAHLTFSDIGVASDRALDVAPKARVLSPRIDLVR